MAKKTPVSEPAVETNPVQSPEPVLPTVAQDEPASQKSAADDAFDAAVAAHEQVAAELDPTAAISFAEPPAEVDPSKAVFSDEADAPLISKDQMDALRREAQRDNEQRDFTLKVLAARKPIEEVHVPPPVADRVRQQTLDEMAAGAKMNRHYEEHHKRHGGPRPEPEQAKAVFRPGDYVPDPKKGQGFVPSRNL